MIRYRLLHLLGVVFATQFVQFAVAQRGPVVLPPGTQIQVRMIDDVSSEKANPGDRFRGTLEAPVIVNHRVLFPKNTEVAGQVVSAKPSGRLSEPGELELALTGVRTNAGWRPLQVESFLIKGESHTRNNAAKIGGGAALGAIIGAIAGGGKGAAIGAALGGGAGAAAAAKSGKRPAYVESEAVLVWVVGPPIEERAGREPDVRGDDYREARGGDGDYQRDADRGRDRDHRDYDRHGDFRVFSRHDQEVIQSCYVDDRSGLPPGLAKKDRLPPGLERQLRRNGTLPPGLQKRVQPLPAACDARLPRLPANWGRVVLSGRVLLLDPGYRIVDVFELRIY